MKLEQLLEGVPFTLAQGSLDTEISDHLRQPQGGTGPFVRVHRGHPA